MNESSALIQKALNGYILTFGGNMFVFTNLHQVVGFIYEKYEPAYKGETNEPITITK